MGNDDEEDVKATDTGSTARESTNATSSFTTGDCVASDGNTIDGSDNHTIGSDNHTIDGTDSNTANGTDDHTLGDDEDQQEPGNGSNYLRDILGSTEERPSDEDYMMEPNKKADSTMIDLSEGNPTTLARTDKAEADDEEAEDDLNEQTTLGNDSDDNDDPIILNENQQTTADNDNEDDDLVTTDAPTDADNISNGDWNAVVGPSGWQQYLPNKMAYAVATSSQKFLHSDDAKWQHYLFVYNLLGRDLSQAHSIICKSHVKVRRAMIHALNCMIKAAARGASLKNIEDYAKPGFIDFICQNLCDVEKGTALLDHVRRITVSKYNIMRVAAVNLPPAGIDQLPFVQFEKCVLELSKTRRTNRDEFNRAAKIIAETAPYRIPPRLHALPLCLTTLEAQQFLSMKKHIAEMKVQSPSKKRKDKKKDKTTSKKKRHKKTHRTQPRPMPTSFHQRQHASGELPGTGDTPEFAMLQPNANNTNRRSTVAAKRKKKQSEPTTIPQQSVYWDQPETLEMFRGRSKGAHISYPFNAYSTFGTKWLNKAVTRLGNLQLASPAMDKQVRLRLIHRICAFAITYLQRIVNFAAGRPTVEYMRQQVHLSKIVDHGLLMLILLGVDEQVEYFRLLALALRECKRPDTNSPETDARAQELFDAVRLIAIGQGFMCPNRCLVNLPDCTEAFGAKLDPSMLNDVLAVCAAFHINNCDSVWDEKAKKWRTRPNMQEELKESELIFAKMAGSIDRALEAPEDQPMSEAGNSNRANSAPPAAPPQQHQRVHRLFGGTGANESGGLVATGGGRPPNRPPRDDDNKRDQPVAAAAPPDDDDIEMPNVPTHSNSALPGLHARRDALYGNNAGASIINPDRENPFRDQLMQMPFNPQYITTQILRCPGSDALAVAISACGKDVSNDAAGSTTSKLSEAINLSNKPCAVKLEGMLYSIFDSTTFRPLHWVDSHQPLLP